jgi:hypothetical protein
MQFSLCPDHTGLCGPLPPGCGEGGDGGKGRAREHTARRRCRKLHGRELRLPDWSPMGILCAVPLGILTASALPSGVLKSWHCQVLQVLSLPDAFIGWQSNASMTRCCCRKWAAPPLPCIWQATALNVCSKHCFCQPVHRRKKRRCWACFMA